MQPAVLVFVRRKHGSWGEQQIEDTTNDVLGQLMDPIRRRLADVRDSFSGLFWTVTRRLITSIGRKLGSQKALGEAVDEDATRAAHDGAFHVPGTASAPPGVQRRMHAQADLAAIDRALRAMRPKRVLALLSELAADLGPELFAEARRAAATALSRPDDDVLAALRRVRPGDPQSKAEAALGPGAKVNTFQQNLSRARADLRRALAESALHAGRIGDDS